MTPVAERARYGAGNVRMSLAVLFNAKFGGTQQHPYKLENVRMLCNVNMENLKTVNTQNG